MHKEKVVGWTTWISGRRLRRINAELRARDLPLLQPDDGCRGAYLVNALERVPPQNRPAILEIVRRKLVS